MAVSPAYTFDYEVCLQPRPGAADGFEGTAESVQEREGALPGLAGSGPVVRLAGDRVRIEPRRLSSAASKVLGAVLVVVALSAPGGLVRDWNGVSVVLEPR